MLHDSMHQEQSITTRAKLMIRNYALSKINSSHSQVDWEGWKQQQQQPQHNPIRRYSSQRGYRPRSASLRRMRSVHARRLGDSSPSKRTAKMEADISKLQEEISLLAACARGDLNKVEKMVDSGVDVNSSDQNQMTALHYAAMHTRDDVIKSLISRGAEVNTSDLKGGFSAIHWAVINAIPKYSSTDHLEGCLTALSEAGCRVNATDFNYATPLHIAAQKGNRDAIQVLLRLRADPNRVDVSGRNAFDVAKNEQIKIYMKTLVDMSYKKDNQLESKHIYDLEAPLPSIPSPLPPVLPPRFKCAGKSSQNEHIYHTLEPLSPPFSSSGLQSTSETPPPLPPRRCHHYPQTVKESHVYHILEPIPTTESS